MEILAQFSLNLAGSRQDPEITSGYDLQCMRMGANAHDNNITVHKRGWTAWSGLCTYLGINMRRLSHACLCYTLRCPLAQNHLADQQDKKYKYMLPSKHQSKVPSPRLKGNSLVTREGAIVGHLLARRKPRLLRFQSEYRSRLVIYSINTLLLHSTSAQCVPKAELGLSLEIQRWTLAPYAHITAPQSFFSKSHAAPVRAKSQAIRGIISTN
jgi:hypothetical protein